MSTDEAELRDRFTLRFVRGRNLIAAVRGLREFTGFGLMQAKTVVDNNAVFAFGLDAEAVVAAVEYFAAIDVELERLPEPNYLYAFDPNSRARGDQILERLSWSGSRLVVERGQLADREWTPVESSDHPERADLEARIKRHTARWRQVGLELERDALALLARLSASEPGLELERRLRSGVHAAEVHGDWLQARGDPRGLLGLGESQAARAELLEDHASHLFGPLAAVRDSARMQWRRGMVEALSLDLPSAVLGLGTGLDQARRWLSLPAMACLRELGLRAHDLSSSALAPLINDPHLAGLRSLKLMGASRGRIELAGCEWSKLTKLEILRIYGSEVHLDEPHHNRALRLPSLRSLELDLLTLSPHLTEALLAAELPALDYLGLALQDAPDHGLALDYGTELVRVLSEVVSKGVPRVEFSCRFGALSEGLVATLIQTRVLTRARHIILDAPVTPAARALLLNQAKQARNLVLGPRTGAASRASEQARRARK